jgi:hypothetical protein
MLKDHQRQRARGRGRWGLSPRVIMLEERVLLSGGAPSVFADVTDPVGLVTDPAGDVFVSYIEINAGVVSSIVGEFSPQGKLLNQFTVSSGIWGTPGSLFVVESASALGMGLANGDVLTLAPNGQVDAIRPSTGALTPLFNLANLNVDTTSIYDVAQGKTWDFDGRIDPAIATFGALAVFDNEIFASGICNGLAFVLRVQFQNGAVSAVKVLIASSATEPNSTLPRGIGVNARGMALTTLPVDPNGVPSMGVDELVAFGHDFDRGTGPSPFLPLNEHVDSRAIATDGRGDFLIATGPLGSALSGNVQAIVVVDAPITRFRPVVVSSTATLNTQGIATGPGVGLVYETVTNLNQVWQTSYPVPDSVASDFLGDGKTDLAVFAPSTATWSIAGIGTFAFGAPGDIPVPGDYDGDWKTDVAVYRPSTSTWYILGSSAGPSAVTFGGPGDIPVPGDYQGNGQTEIAVYDPRTSTFYILCAGGTSAWAVQFGGPGDIPVPADYDGDGKTDIAVFDPRTATFYVLPSDGRSAWALPFGGPGDVPIPADYDNVGRADIAVFRPSTDQWFLIHANGAGQMVAFGGPGDLPVPGAYSGGGVRLAVYRSSMGEWFIAGMGGFPFGTPWLDLPVNLPEAYLALGVYSPPLLSPSAISIASTGSNTILGINAAGADPASMPDTLLGLIIPLLTDSSSAPSQNAQTAAHTPRALDLLASE